MFPLNLKKALLSLLAVLALYFAWWFFTHLEKVDNDGKPEPTIEAEMQPYLALSEFLKSKGYQVHMNTSWSELDKIDIQNSVVVIPYLSPHLPQFQRQQLNKFLKKGHIIFGIVPSSRSNWLNEENQSETSDFRNNEMLSRFHLTLYKEESDQYGTSTLMDREITFEMPDNWMFEEKNDGKDTGYWSYWMEQNTNSKIIIIPEFFIFNNQHIGKRDNALLFLSFLQVDDENKTHTEIWILSEPITPGFFHLLWQNFSFAILALALLGILLLWNYGIRFGGIYPLFKPARKELKEHLDAVANWDWNHSHAEHLIKNIFMAINRKMKYSYNDWESYDQQKQIRLISRHTGISIENISTTWNLENIHSRTAFLRLIQQLQTIRTHL